MKLSVGALALGVCVAVQAAAPVITSFSQNGVLVCSNLVPGTVASVEGKVLSVPAGPWTNIAGLDSVPVDSSGRIQVSVSISNVMDEVMMYRVRGVPPVEAGFTGSPANGLAPLVVSFINLSSGATNYSWDFGDGNSSASVNPSNTYSNAGSYTVSLTAVGAGGTNSLTRTNYIVATQSSNPPGMVIISAGSFGMGNSMSPGEGWSDELPLHTNYVSGFYMDRNEVSQAQWDAVKAWNGGNGYSFENAGLGKAPTHPVQTVSWRDCVKWCNARSEQEGLTPCYYNEVGLATVYKAGTGTPYPKWNANGYRLPTEAEWEKAARGGASGHRFPWSDVETISHTQANYYSSGGYAYDVSPTAGYHPDYNAVWPYTSPVGSFGANGYGLYDMAGNVWEWCWDWYGSTYYTASPTNDPQGPASGNDRVLRGGVWLNYAYGARCASRSYSSPSNAGPDVGFRCVRGF